MKLSHNFIQNILCVPFLSSLVRAKSLSKDKYSSFFQVECQLCHKGLSWAQFSSDRIIFANDFIAHVLLLQDDLNNI